jgi:TP901 family phage tail tape measure protein
MNALEFAAKASTAGLGDTQAVALAAASSMTAFAGSNMTAERATDILTATVREGNLSAEQLASSISSVLPVAAAAGVKLEEVGAAAAIITRSGASAGEAMTQIRAAILALSAPTARTTARLEEMGLGATELQTILREDGLVAAMQRLEEATDGDASAMRSALGSVEALSGAYTILGTDGETLSSVFDGIANSAGDTQAAFEAATSTSAFKFEQAMNNIRIALVELGAVIAPIIAEAASFVAKLIGMFSDLPGPVQKVVIVVAALAAAMGPLLVVAGAVVSAMGALGGAAAVAGMAMAAIPWVAGAVAVGVLAAAIWKLGDAKRAASDRADELTTSMRDLTKSYEEAAAAGIAANDVTQKASDAMDKVGLSMADMVDLTENGTDAFQDLGDSLGGASAMMETGLDAVGAAAVQLQELAEATRDTEPEVAALAEEMRQWVLQGAITVEEARALANAIDENADAFDDTRESMQSNAAALAEVAGGEALAAKEAAILSGILDAATDGFGLTEIAAEDTAEGMLALAQANIEAASSVEGIRAILDALAQGLVLTEDEALALAAAEDLAADGAMAWDVATFGVVDALGEETRAAAEAEDAAEALARAEEVAADQAEILAAQHEGLVKAMDEATVQLQESIDGFVSMESAYDAAAKAADDANRSVTMQDWINEQERLITETQAWASNIESLHGRVGDDLITEIASWGPEAAGKVALLANATDDELKVFEQNWQEAGALSNQLLNDELAQVKDAMVRTMASAILESAIIGQNIVAALAGSIDSNSFQAAQAAGRLASSIIEATGGVLLVASPSKVFMEIGRNVAEGLGIGIQEGGGFAADSAAEMAQIVIDAMGTSVEDGIERIKETISSIDLANEWAAIWEGLAAAEQELIDADEELAAAERELAEATAERIRQEEIALQVTLEEEQAIRAATQAVDDASDASRRASAEYSALADSQRPLSGLSRESADAIRAATDAMRSAESQIRTLEAEQRVLAASTRDLNDASLESDLSIASLNVQYLRSIDRVGDMRKELEDLTKAGKDTTLAQAELDLELLRQEDTANKLAVAQDTVVTHMEAVVDKAGEVSGAYSDLEGATEDLGVATGTAITHEEALRRAYEEDRLASGALRLSKESLKKIVEESTGPTDDLKDALDREKDAQEDVEEAAKNQALAQQALIEKQAEVQLEVLKLMTRFLELQEEHDKTGKSAGASGGVQVRAAEDTTTGIETELTKQEENQRRTQEAIDAIVADHSLRQRQTLAANMDGMLTDAPGGRVRSEWSAAMDGMVATTNTQVATIKQKLAQIPAAAKAANEAAAREAAKVSGASGFGQADAGALLAGTSTPSAPPPRIRNPVNGFNGGTRDSRGDLILFPRGGWMPERGPVLSDGRHRLAGVLPGELVLTERQQDKLLGGGGGINITINVEGDLDPAAGERVVEKLRQYVRANGSLPVSVRGGL